MQKDDPLVSVVVVNLDGRRFLGGLMETLHAQDYGPFEIIMVDNGSVDDSVSFVGERFPRVRVVELSDNVGFAQGNNLGIEKAKGRYVALINNDTLVDPSWLRHLVTEARASHEIGAVCSKILFARPFLSVRIEVPALTPSNLGISDDNRALGMVVALDSSFDACSYRKPIFRSGFFPAEVMDGREACWTGPSATLDLPIERPDEAATLKLQICGGQLPGPREVTIAVGDRMLASVEVDGQWREYVVPVGEHIVRENSFDIINNAGSDFSEDGSARDRGIFEVDRGQFDASEDVGAFCGCSVLFSRDALENVGLFDRDYFAYFEDIELSWRLKKNGYRLHYQPASVVRHYHASTTGEWSPSFTFLVVRNRILMLLKHANPLIAAQAYIEETLRFLRALAARIRKIHPGRIDSTRQELRTRLRIQLSLLRQAPKALLKRAGLLPH
jgi:GT2 family glycosyltransferase